MKLLNGKNAIVTGSARGIGKAIAREFLDQGANVMITDIDERLGNESCEQLSIDQDNKVLFRKMDVTSEDEVRMVFDQAISIFGRIDIMVNNAALLIPSLIKDFTLDDWKKVFDVNMNGTFICSRVAVNHMIDLNIKGCILNIGSAASRKADHEHSAYSSSKAAIVEFSRVLALEVGKYGIRVNTILPGATDTEMLRDVFSKVKGLKEDIVGRNVMGKLAKPRDIANSAVFLCSDMASHITGEYLLVTGGEFFNA